MRDVSGTPTQAVAADVARRSYARLLAMLASRDGDIAAAEDCLSDAFVQALSTWPERGIPANPEAWLITVARNRRRDTEQSAAARQTDRLDDHRSPSSSAATWHTLDTLDADEIPDRRLALLFVCAHPAIDPAVRTPLMLQTVLGFEADAVARAFAMPTATMAQRLVRAKQRIRNTRIPFVVPERTKLQDRLAAVLEAIYGAYAIEYPLVAGVTVRESLSHESLYLARVLSELMPTEPEVLALAALIALSLARRPAMQRDGRFVPLDEQDTALWDAALAAEGTQLLARADAAINEQHHAGVNRERGRFHLEATIQRAHLSRRIGVPTDWHVVLALHSQLLAVAPTLGARVAHAAAVGRVEGASAGLAALDAIAMRDTPPSAVQRFQPWWAARAHLLLESGDEPGACEAYARCIALTTDPLLRAWLTERADALKEKTPDRSYPVER